MRQQEINYAKEILTSNYNYAFLGIMFFLMIVFNFWGFLTLAALGEMVAYLTSFSSQIQRIIYLKTYKNNLIDLREAEKSIISELSAQYREDFRSIQALCDNIEKRATEIDNEGGANMSGVLEKLTTLRYEYARRLKLHYLLTTTDRESNVRELNESLQDAEKELREATSGAARQSWQQTIEILKKRLAQTKKIGERIKEVEAQLRLVKNLLGLFYDDVRTSSLSLSDISDMADNLVAKLETNTEYDEAYEALDNPIIKDMRLPIKQASQAKTSARPRQTPRVRQ